MSMLREFLAVMSRPQTVPGGRGRPDVAHQLHALLAVGDTRGKQIHDANIVATMLAHGIRTLPKS
jgi:predicted nucleic acid-binding protein